MGGFEVYLFFFINNNLKINRLFVTQFLRIVYKIDVKKTVFRSKLFLLRIKSNVCQMYFQMTFFNPGLNSTQLS